MISVVITINNDECKAGKHLHDATIKEMSLAISQMEVIKKDLVNFIEELMKQENQGGKNGSKN